MSQIDELRQIIVGDNAELLDELKQRIESVEQRTKDVAEVLPGAIEDRLDTDNRLVDSFKKPVSIGLKQAIRTEPDAYAEILYPVMAPSIRRAISQAISSMIATINQTIQSATSAQGIALRVESWRTGVPYGQLMLQRSLLFRVEHIYLIDRETSMCLREAQALGVHSLDGDAVSAMFTAIQSFVQDSFANDSSERLTEFKSDQFKVWITHGSSMMLACVISGDAPESLRQSMDDTLDDIHVEFANESADFNGDTSTFEGVEEHLNPLLQLQMKEDVDSIVKKEKKGPGPWIVGLLFSLGLIAILLMSFHRYSQLKTVEHFMREAPGIALTDAYWDGGQIVVEGLQDPDAEVPFAKLSNQGVDSDKVLLKTIPFRSLEFGMELQRFKKEFALPDGVQFGVNGQQISLYGQSPLQWLLDNDVRLRQLSADRRIDISNLSASLVSVTDRLEKDFNEDDLSNIVPVISIVQDRIVVELTGSMPEHALRQLNAMFARNHWVVVSAQSVSYTHLTLPTTSRV